ncbi:hypothetical protein DRN58_06870, partial [Thermococci archaeon]
MKKSIFSKNVLDIFRKIKNNRLITVPFKDEEIRSFCVCSLCKSLRNQVKEEDFDLVKWMLVHKNYNINNLGQILLKPFIIKFNKKEELKPFLIKLWRASQNDDLKTGLLFDLFLYNEDELGHELVEGFFSYLERKIWAFTQMIEEWFEKKTNMLEVIKVHLEKNKDNHLKIALWILALTSVLKTNLKEA